MLKALYACIAGLQSNQQTIDVIGNNISNVNTIGFKSSRMTFSDVINKTMSNGSEANDLHGGINPKQIGMGMKVGSIDTNFSQGILQTTDMTTDLAIEGDGFFVVNDGTTSKFTRAGSFQIDTDGNLLTQCGKYSVQGKIADSAGNLISGSTVGNIKIPYNTKFPAQATEEINFHFNLNALTDVGQNNLTDKLVNSSSINIYDSQGNKHSIEISFTKNQGQDNLWNWEVKVDGSESKITAGNSGFVSFNNDGSIAQMSALDGKDLSFNPGCGAETMEIQLDGGASGSFSGITQYNSSATNIAYEQNGYSAGILKDVYFDDTGKIIGEYTNGQSRNIAQVAMATFANEGGLLKAGDNFYQASANSGHAEIGMAGEDIVSSIHSGNLESSNVDLSKELINMIIAQRNYQASAKMITTIESLFKAK